MSRSVSLAAPASAPIATTYLPTPEFGNSEALENEMKVHTAFDGTMRTYVKTNDRRKLKLEFILTKNKSLELFEFYRAYRATEIRYKDFAGVEWIGNFVDKPVVAKCKPIRGRILPWPVGEMVTVKFELAVEAV